MKITIKTLLVLIGLFCLGLAAIGIGYKKIHFGWLGLFILGIAYFVEV